MPESLTARLIDGVTQLSELLAAGDAEPAGGLIAAIVATWAASLAAAAADRSRDRWDAAGGARAQAQELRRRALGIADRDVDAYARARAALAGRSMAEEPDPRKGDEARDWRLGEVVKEAAEPPLELAACCLDVARLAQLIAAHAADDIRADAAIAALLAATAARSAAHLVEINLVVGADEEQVARARGYAEAAASAAAAAAEVGG